MVQATEVPAEEQCDHPDSELADPLDKLTWEIVFALGGKVSTKQWLAVRELLARFEPEPEAIDLEFNASIRDAVASLPRPDEEPALAGDTAPSPDGSQPDTKSLVEMVKEASRRPVPDWGG